MIKMSTKARYGARAITYIAAFGNGRPVSINEVSEKEGISLKYLERIMSSLRSSGLVSSIKGAHGGYIFSKDQEKVTLSDIVDSLEGPVNLIDCLKDSSECKMEEYCGLLDIWKDINNTLNEKFRSITIKQMVEKKISNQEHRNPIYYI